MERNVLYESSKRKSENEKMNKIDKRRKKSEVMDLCEKNASESRVAFYDQIRIPIKRWPQIDLNFSSNEGGEPFFEQSIEKNKDFLRLIVSYLSPKEYQSLSLVTKNLNLLLHQNDIFYQMLVSTVNYLISSGANPESVFMKWLTTDKASYSSKELLRIAIQRINPLISPNTIPEILEEDLVDFEIRVDASSQFTFFDTSSGQFGDLSHDMMISQGLTDRKKRSAKAFRKKYGFRCDKNRNILNARDLEKLEFCSISEIPQGKFCIGDIYLRDHNSVDNYLRPLQEFDNIVIFDNRLESDRVDIYYDWFVIRNMMKSYYSSYVDLKSFVRRKK